MMHVPHQTREQNQKACSQWTHQFVAILTFIFACIHSASSFNVFLIVETRLLTSASGFWGCCRVDMRYVMVVVLSLCIFWPPVQRGHDCSLRSGDGIRHGVSGGRGTELWAIYQGAACRGGAASTALRLQGWSCMLAIQQWVLHFSWLLDKYMGCLEGSLCQKKGNVLWTCYCDVHVC